MIAVTAAAMSVAATSSSKNKHKNYTCCRKDISNFLSTARKNNIKLVIASAKINN